MKWLAGKYVNEISGQYLDRDLYGKGNLSCKLVYHLAGDSLAPVSSIPLWGPCPQQEVGDGGPHLGLPPSWVMVAFGESSGLPPSTPHPLCTSCFGGVTLSFAFFIHPVRLHPYIHPYSRRSGWGLMLWLLWGPHRVSHTDPLVPTSFGSFQDCDSHIAACDLHSLFPGVPIRMWPLKTSPLRKGVQSI